MKLRILSSCINYPFTSSLIGENPIFSIKQSSLNLNEALKVCELQSPENLPKKDEVEEGLKLLNQIQDDILLNKFDRVRITYHDLCLFEIDMEKNTSQRTVVVPMDKYKETISLQKSSDIVKLTLVCLWTGLCLGVLYKLVD